MGMGMSVHAAAEGRFSDGEFTPAIAARTAALHERVRTVIPDFEWPAFAPDIDADPARSSASATR